MSDDTDLRIQLGARERIEQAVRTGDALSGTAGFAGRIDGSLVRDVLGRVPLFVEADAANPFASDAWAFRPTELTDPAPVPAGHRLDRTGRDRLWELPRVETATARESAIEAVRTAVTTSVDAVAGPDLAIAFSGGIDSAILAARLDAPLYVGGFPGSHDIEAARSAATALDADLHVVEFTHDDLAAAVPEVVAATDRANAMDIQIALGLFLVARRVAADGFDRLALGQGADELFGGYAKVAKAPSDPRVDAETVRGARRELVRSLPEQAPRDVLTVRAAGLTPETPLLHDRVVRAALALPGPLLVTASGERKVALRRAARDWVPDRICEREKKAVQYGTYVARELDRLARQAGFKRRMDNHVDQYIESLLG
jgi:asparagine synthase (glutamine-hydrolysing)